MIVEQAFLSRADALEALETPLDAAGGARLREAAESALLVGATFGRAPAAADWRAFADSLKIGAHVLDWWAGVYSAEPDADRHLRAAKLRLSEMRVDIAEGSFRARLAARLDPVMNGLELNEVGAVIASIAREAMPLGLFAEPVIESRLPRAAEREPRKEDLAVAFLEFRIDGRPADTIHSLRANQVHDLDLTIRVSRWPERATIFRVSPMSIEPASVWDLPSFDLQAPSGEPPYIFERRGRMVLHASQGINARPLEFLYAAEFQPSTGDQPVVIAGQRTLRLDGTDPSTQPISGWLDIDRKIIALRNEIRLEPLVSEEDVMDLLRLLVPLGALMGQAVQDARYPKPIDENAFQEDVRQFLRSHPFIGSALEEQPHVAGGRADLSFRGIRIELKSEQRSRLTPDDCKKFAGQAASYAAGTGRRLALLCVLDCSPKYEAPFPLGDGVFIEPVRNGTTPFYIVTCLIQGGLPKPSSLSR